MDVALKLTLFAGVDAFTILIVYVPGCSIIVVQGIRLERERERGEIERERGIVFERLKQVVICSRS